MKKMQSWSGLILALWVSISFAHGPSRVKVEETIVINASADKVWDLIKDYDKIHTWLPAIESTDATGGNEVDATRVLTLKGGGTITEELKKYKADKKSMKYRITEMSTAKTVHHELSGEDVDVPVLPVNNYSATITVKEQDGQAEVTWKAAFYRAFLNNEPPPEMNEEAGKAAVSGVFKAGLENLKTMAEGSQ
ncbi:MAG: SRPBCC family protein [Methylococcales bacterium]